MTLVSRRGAKKVLLSAKSNLFTEWERGFIHGCFYNPTQNDRDILLALCAKAGFSREQVMDEVDNDPIGRAPLDGIAA